MKNSNTTDTVFIITEKWEECDWFNTIKKNRKLIESVSVSPLVEFEDRAVFVLGASRTKVRRLRTEEAATFNLPNRFICGAHVCVVRIDERTAVRSLVFDSKYQRCYEAIIEKELRLMIEEIKDDMARAIALCK